MTATGHQPRPIVWFRPGASILIVGQAPGLRVHELACLLMTARATGCATGWALAGRNSMTGTMSPSCRWPFAFRAMTRKAAICRRRRAAPPPGAKRSWACCRGQADHRDRWLCAGMASWRGPSKGGGHATVEAWRSFAPAQFPLPHPSWRNNAFLRRNPWFESELLPALKARVRNGVCGWVRTRHQPASRKGKEKASWFKPYGMAASS